MSSASPTQIGRKAAKNGGTFPPAIATEFAITTRHDSAVLPVAALIAQANAMLGTLVTLPLDHPDFDLINARWMKLCGLIERTPSRSLQDQVAQLHHLVAILVDQEDVSPATEMLARKALAELAATAAN